MITKTLTVSYSPVHSAHEPLTRPGGLSVTFVAAEIAAQTAPAADVDATVIGGRYCLHSRHREVIVSLGDDVKVATRNVMVAARNVMVATR